MSPAVWQMQQPSGCLPSSLPGLRHSAKRSGLTQGGRWLGSAAHEGSGAPESSHLGGKGPAVSARGRYGHTRSQGAPTARAGW